MTSVARRLASALGAAGLLGCPIGTSVGGFHPAKEPGGAQVALSIRAGTPPGETLVDGELLAVRDTALLILRGEPGPRVALVPLRGILRGEFQQLHGSPRIEDGRFSSPWALAQLRLVSRYPQGVSDTLLRALLAACHQTEIDVLAP